MKIKNIILTCIVSTLALLMFSTNSLATENITFTDSVFKEQVLYHGMTADYSVADQNSDGEISVEEAEQISIIDIYSKCSLADLEYLPNLTRLCISSSDFDSLDDLNNIKLENLKTVWFYNNPKLEDISVLGKFDTIKDISITDMPVVDVSFLGNLVNLEQVSLNYLNISDVSSLNNNENLKYINFNGLSNLKDISSLNNLPNLIGFRMFGSGVTNISALSKSTKLETLATQYLKMKNLDFMKNYTKLSYLEMTHGTLEDISGLSNCTALEVAILHNNNISNIDVFENCPKLFTLNISANPLSDIEVLVSLNSQAHVFIDTGVNPYDDATFHVLCTIVERGGHYLLGDCSKFEPKEDENGLTFTLNDDKTGYILTGCSNDDLTNLVIPDLFNGLPVVEIKPNAFENANIERVKFGKNIIKIGAMAFYNCKKLAGEIVFPESLKELESCAFTYCENISSIKLNEGLEKIESATFADCINLTGELKLPSTMKVVDAFSFNNTDFNTIILNDELEIINSSAFFGNDNLKGELKLPSNLKELGSNAFGGCTGITGTIYIPNGITKLYGAFNDCTNITKVEISGNLESIEHNAFKGMTSLYEVVLPEKVNTFQGYIFDGCTSLKEDFIFPKSITNFVGFEMFANSSIENVSLPTDCEVVPGYLFSYCTSLRTVVLPRDVETITIPKTAFSNTTGLEKIIIPKNIKSINHDEEWVSFAKQNRNCSENFAIYGYKGTYAEEYATQNGYKFVSMDQNTLKETKEVSVDDEIVSVMPIDKLTKIEDVLKIESFPTIGDYEIVVVDKDGNEKDSTQKLGSRDVIQIKDDEGNVIEEHVVVVNGDVNGDGEVKMYDSFQILKGSIMNSNNDAIETLIRDKNGDGKVMMYDAFQFLKQAIIG